MNIIQKTLRPAGPVLPSLMLGLMQCAALAQDTTTTANGTAAGQNGGLISRLTENLPGGMLGTAAIVVVIVVLVAGVIALASRKRQEIGDEIYPEPTAVESSKFEQLLAETQGLFLRIQGGESKGYYRKIEQLARIFLERIGIQGARQMPYDEIQGLLAGGAVPQKQAGTLVTIFERCKQGSEHEGEKIDFTAAELIKDLRGLVKQAAEETSPRIPQ